MTRPFIFDPAAALEKLASGYLSPVSQMRRQRVPPHHEPPVEDKSWVTGCSKSDTPMFVSQSDPRALKVSQMSQVSPPLLGARKLSGDDLCRFEERAAIMEYQGRLPRPVAEAMAMIDLVRNTTEATARRVSI